MLYMYLAVPAVAVAAKGAAGGMGGMSATGSRFSFLALVLALFMFGYVVRVGDRLTVQAPALAVAVPAGAVPAANRPEEPGALMTATGPESAGGRLAGGCAGADPRTPVSQGTSYLAPRCAAMCKIAMGITMGYMLILML